MAKKKSGRFRRRSRLSLTSGEQMEAVVSPLRQDILNTFTAIGPCSIKQVADEVGKPSDAIYYHVRKLLSVGLLQHLETRPTQRRDESIYDVPAEKLELSYDLDDPKIAEAIQRIALSMLRRASKHFAAAMELESVEPIGPERNFRVMSGTAWLSRKDLREVNRHLDAIIELTAKPRSGQAGQLCSFTGVLSPLKALARGRDTHTTMIFPLRPRDKSTQADRKRDL